MWSDIVGFFENAAARLSRVPIVKWALKKLGIDGSSAPQPQRAPAAGKPSAQPSASDSAINAVLRREDSTLSGKVTSDSGGITKFGISSNVHPGLDVANLSLGDAKAIIKGEYWDAIGGDKLSPAIAGTALDAAVNQGVGNAKKWLALSGGDPVKFNALRRKQYENLAASDPAKYGKYLKGWLSRVPSDAASSVAAASWGVGAGAGGASSVAVPPVSGAATAALAANGGNTTNIDNDTRVGTINIVTQANDAKGIAGAITPQLKRAMNSQLAQQGQS